MNGLPEAQDDAGVVVRGKARMLQTNLIGTDCQLICPKETLIIGPYGARLSCQSVAQCNRRLRYHGAAAVTDCTLKTRRNSRSLSEGIRPAQQQSGRDCHLDNSTTQGKQPAMPNHRSPIFKTLQDKPKHCLDRIQGRSYAAQEKANRFLCASGVAIEDF
jgi:hypothetical protein